MNHVEISFEMMKEAFPAYPCADCKRRKKHPDKCYKNCETFADWFKSEWRKIRSFFGKETEERW